MEKEKKKNKMSQLYKSNMFALGLLLIGAILAVINVVGYAVNPNLFTSFSIVVTGVIASIAAFMLYNIKKISDEMNSRRK